MMIPMGLGALAAVAAALFIAPGLALADSEARPLPGLHPDIRAALVSIEADESSLLDVFGQLRDQALLNVAFDEHVSLSQRVGFTGRGRLALVLPGLLEAAGLSGKAYNAHTLLVYPDRREKLWEYAADNPANAPRPRLKGRRAERGHVYDLEDATIDRAFAAFAEHSGCHVTLDEDLDRSEILDFRTDLISAADALELLCLRLGLTFQQTSRRRLLVYRATPEKMFEHDDPRTLGLTPADFEMPADFGREP